MIHALSKKLSRRLTEPLPGWEAQLKMAPRHRIPLPRNNHQAIPSAVMIVLSAYQEANYIVLVKRKDKNPRDKHRGQIGFPGGKKEPADASFLDTAIRETREEVGVTIAGNEILGALTPLYIPVSNFSVNPFLCVIDRPLKFVPQESEIDWILQYPLEELLDLRHLQQKEIKTSTGIVLSGVPCLGFQHEVIWGATAMMLSELREIILDIS